MPAGTTDRSRLTHTHVATLYCVCHHRTCFGRESTAFSSCVCRRISRITQEDSSTLAFFLHFALAPPSFCDACLNFHHKNGPASTVTSEFVNPRTHNEVAIYCRALWKKKTARVESPRFEPTTRPPDTRKTMQSVLPYIALHCTVCIHSTTPHSETEAFRNLLARTKQTLRNDHPTLLLPLPPPVSSLPYPNPHVHHR